MSRSLPARRRDTRPVRARRRALALLLTMLTALPLPAVFSQELSSTKGAGEKTLWVTSAERLDSTYVIYQNEDGETTCRVATPDEAAELGAGTNVELRQINHLDDGRGLDGAGRNSATSNATAAGLTIILRATSQLDSNPEAKAAFIAAAAKWEALIQDQITVIIDVDYGTTFFGTAFSSSNVLGATDSQGLLSANNYTSVRQRLIDRASNDQERAVYSSLPATSLPTDIGSTSTIVVESPALRALGLLNPVANPTTETNLGPPPRIGFNSAFGFDFNPADGITGTRTDFDAVAVHEMGHALGFTSNVGERELAPTSPVRAGLWDLFRFRPSTAQNAFSTATRILSSGGEQVHYDGAGELRLSTGKPDGTGGDGEQASHWKDNAQTGLFIGIMDPTIPRNRREELTANDIRAIDFLGFRLGPPAPPPANDNFAAAQGLSGATGTATGTNIGATSETGDPNPAGVSGTVSVWYRWTAPAGGTAVFDTIGSNYDTTLGVYRGGGLGALDVVAQNDDIVNSEQRQSRVTFTPTAGETYHIQVNGWNGETGNIVFNWTATAAPSNFRVAGRVTDNFGSVGDAATVQLLNSFGAPLAQTTTDSLGNYAFNGISTGNYIVRVSKSGFTAADAPVNNLAADRTVNVVMTVVTVSVSGLIRDAQGNVINGVGYTVTGFGTQTAASDGSYSFGIRPHPSAPVTITPVKYGYTFTPASATFNTTASGNVIANFTGALNNPIDASSAFVRQHYLDFLGREPDQAGLDFWRSGMDQCGPNVSCTEVRRIDTSAAFFFAIEFQETGVLVYRMWKAAYAGIDGTPIPVRRQQFLEDSQLVAQNVQVGVGNWAEQLEANKVAYANTFANRAVFKNKYDPMTNEQFVDALNQNAEFALSPTERNALVAALNNGASRGSVLRAVAEDETLRQSQLRKAFVLMQYFGYLRRDPDAPDFRGIPDPQFLGYNFWLGKLNDFNGSYIDAEMVKAFITSIEYRQRFGQ